MSRLLLMLRIQWFSDMLGWKMLRADQPVMYWLVLLALFAAVLSCLLLVTPLLPVPLLPI